jgi:hypothetical protein
MIYMAIVHPGAQAIDDVLTVLAIFCEGPVQSISDLRFNDVPLPNAVVRTYLGTQNQPVDPFIQAYFPLFNETLPGTAYAVIHIQRQMSEALTRGFPEITAVVNGRSVRDPRLGAGVGPVWSINGGTKVVGNNPALCIGDMLENVLGVPVNDAALINAANYCESQGNTISIAITEKLDGFGWVDVLRSYVPGWCVEINGEWHVIPDMATPSVGSITPRDIDMSTPPSLAQRGPRDMPNVVEVEWTDSSTWPATSRIVTAQAANLHGEVRKSRVMMPGIQAERQAQRMADLRLAHYQNENIEGEVIVFDHGVQFVPGDVLALTLPAFGFVSKPVRVLSCDSVSDGRWRIRWRAYDDNIYGTPSAVGWVIAQTPINPAAPQWVIAGAPSAPSIEWVLPGVPGAPAVLV